MNKYVIILGLASLYLGCKESTDKISDEPLHVENVIVEEVVEPPSYDYDTLQWSELTERDGFVLDIRYATADNFTGTVIYPCGRCFLRPELAKKIKTLQQDISKRYGWSFKLYDCYRPRPAQQRLWDKVPNASYVTPPHKGSMHNRGLAVDLTIVDGDGEEWDMGSPYDSFSRKSHTDNYDLPPHVLKNREILKKLMKLHGLQGIRTEWWHYSLRGISYPLDDWEWKCPD